MPAASANQSPWDAIVPGQMRQKAGNVIRLALFGAGIIGTVHAGNIAAHRGCTLAYVIDPDLERARRLTDAYGGVAASTIDTALGNGAVDAVIIASFWGRFGSAWWAGGQVRQNAVRETG